MSNELIDFSGYFKIESLDADRNVIDVYEDKNLIMETARTTMSEIFTNLSSNTFINGLRLGTLGHKGTDVLAPKLEAEGFSKNREFMFSESFGSIASPISVGTTISTVHLNDLVYIDDADIGGIITPGFYKYLLADTNAVVLNNVDLNNGSIWELYSTVAPYTYDFTFDLPGTKVDGINGDPVLNLTEPDTGSTITALQSGTSLILNVEVAANAANAQITDYSAFTEAALYANGRIFSMKTFRSKLKDSTVTLRITWKITF